MIAIALAAIARAAQHLQIGVAVAARNNKRPDAQ
jgi:hypothetical protein